MMSINLIRKTCNTFFIKCLTIPKTHLVLHILGFFTTPLKAICYIQWLVTLYQEIWLFMCHCSFCLFSCSFRNWEISTLALLSQNSDLDLMLVRSAELAEILFFAYVARGWTFPCQTSIQDEVWPLQPITITSLLSTQRHFDWAYTYIHTYIHTYMGLGYMCGLAISKEIDEL